jgi:hypothetical protein
MKMLSRIFSKNDASAAMPALPVGGVLVQGADRITRRVSRREDCTPEETSKITEICNLLGTNNIESKLRPLRLVWEMAAEDDVKYKSSFLEFLTDLNSKLINIMNNASSDAKTNLCSNLNATQIIARKFYLLVFKSESLLGTSINHFSIEELIECASTHKELDVLTHNYTLHLIQKGIITPKRALNLLYTSLENNPLQDVITKMQQGSSPSI